MSAANRERQVGRNDPCPCGSGKKYKKCCRGKSGAGPGKGPALPDPTALLAAAGAAFEGQRFEEAEITYRKVLDVRPDHTVAQAGVGACVGRLRDPEQGLRMIRKAAETDPGLAVIHFFHADLLSREAEHHAALDAARRGLGIAPDDRFGLGIAAHCCEHSNRLDEAQSMLDRLFALAPTDPTGTLLQATVEERRGELDAARGRLRALIDRPGIGEQLRSQALTRLGMALDKSGEYDAAFESFAEAGRVAGTTPEALAIDHGLLSHRIARYRAGITAELLDRWSGVSMDDGASPPAFLVGFPRSGTTMTEQVLAAHPGVLTSGEVELVGTIRRALGSSISAEENVPEMLRRLTKERILDLRRGYRERVRTFVGEDIGDRIFVDKNPLNLIDLGLINVVFPDARVIVALRDPRDVCLSCFIQSFGFNVGMINFLTLERTAEVYDETMDLWLHLRPMLGIRFIEVRYEDTVTDLEGQARRILDLLDLPWSPDILRFHERAKDRAISTPSYAEVARPVHRGAVNRWRNYRTWFEPVLPRLRRYVDAFGYAPDDAPD